MNLSELVAAWQQASGPEAVFGPLSPPTRAALQRRYRELAAQSHPDRHPGARAEASEAFKLLQRWYGAAQRRIEQGCYGAAPTLHVDSGSRRYVADGLPLPGDLCDLYPAHDGMEAVLLKVVRDPRNHDLMEAEAQHLTRLDHALEGQAVRAHFPTLVETFRLRDEAGVQRPTHVLRAEPGFVTLAEVVRAYPQGVEPGDAIWMVNRVLAALGVTHGLGLVHGAVLPPHVLIRPHDHNGMLVDWCYSVPTGAPLRAISPAHRAFYPPEVLAGQPATPATDLYMTALCVVQLLGGEVSTQHLPSTVPKALGALLRACLIPAPARRTQDGWELFEALRDVAQRLYGPPRFRPFTLPIIPNGA